MANGPNKPSSNLGDDADESNSFDNTAAGQQQVEQEVTALCNTMDELDSFLDDLEQKNDSLNAKLKALLASMKEEENGDTQAETTEVKKDDGKWWTFLLNKEVQ